MIDVAEARWPMFSCAGLTEVEALNISRHPVENLTESTEDALRRFAGIIAKIEQFIGDEGNQIIMEEHKHDADEIPLVKVTDIQKIIHPED